LTGQPTENRFRGAREAKEFLATQIADQAQRDHQPLSEIERKMLYFSETDWTLPEMSKVSEEFDRDYDQDEYEGKVTALIRSAYKRAVSESRDGYDDWWSAIRLLTKQDHYILVMIRSAGLRPRYDQLKLLVVGVGIAALVGGIAPISLFVTKKYNVDSGKYWLSGDQLSFIVWSTALCLAIVSSLVYFVSRKTHLNGFVGKIVRRLDRIVNGE
jgi:hypothetical protein